MLNLKSFQVMSTWITVPFVPEFQASVNFGEVEQMGLWDS